MIDVGQGDAILVQLPTGHALLVDAGGAPGPFDIGGRVVTPALWALGVRRLDWLALTHGDLDHIGGAPSASPTIWRRARSGKACPCRAIRSGGGCATLRRRARHRRGGRCSAGHASSSAA